MDVVVEIPYADTPLYELLEIAETGNREAEFAVGRRYERGEEVQEDLYEAARWYRSSAEKGFMLAENNFGMFCLNGSGGVRKDLFQAEKWLKRAAEQGEIIAWANLGYVLHLVGDHHRAFGWSLRAAKKGVPAAQNQIGCAYFEGHGCSQDMDEALIWLRLSKRNGCPLAEENLEKVEAYIYEVKRWERDRRRSSEHRRGGSVQSLSESIRSLKDVYATMHAQGYVRPSTPWDEGRLSRTSNGRGGWRLEHPYRR